ncbi:HAD family hydrolase [Clostridium perfringens]
MIKAIVFDLDDTLISERDYIKSGFKVVSNYIEGKYSIDQKKVFNKMEELFKKSTKNVFNRTLEHFKIKYEKEDILKLISIYRNHVPDIKFFDDVIPTLEELRKRGYKLGIITDGYKETQNRKLNALKCREFFDEIIITDELGREYWKPHEKSYKLISEKLDIKPEEYIYVGDNSIKDFVNAKKIGVKTILIKRDLGIYSNNITNKDYMADYEISELKSLLNKIEDRII